MHANPTQRAGIIGIGGLAHMALKFATAHGFHMAALTSSEKTFDEARMLGANEVASTMDPEEF